MAVGRGVKQARRKELRKSTPPNLSTIPFLARRKTVFNINAVSYTHLVGEDQVCLTDAGIDVSNYVMSEFLL